MNLNLSRAKVAFALLHRHLRIAGVNPARWIWVIWRTLRVIGAGGLSAKLDRHAADQELYSEYAAWQQVHLTLNDADRTKITARIREAGPLPLLSVVMPTYDTRPAWLYEAVRSVRDQLYPRWELCVADDCSTTSEAQDRVRALTLADERIRAVYLESNVGIGLASNAAIDLTRGEFVILLDHDDVLAPEALYVVWEAICAFPDADIFYSDEDKLGEDGNLRDPHFKPAWDDDLALTMNYLGHLVAIRRSLLRDVGGFAAGLDGAQDWDLLLRCSEGTTPDRIRHIPRVLYHWRVHRDSTAAGLAAKPGAEHAQRTTIEHALHRRAISGKVTQTDHGWRVERTPVLGKSVSIVIPTRGRVDLLRPLLARLAELTTAFKTDVVVVDQDPDPAAITNLIEDIAGILQVQRVSLPGPFNFARSCNLGASNARGEFVIFLNDDVLPEDAAWLSELITQASRPEVGCVGALLRYPDGRLQHAGVLLGINGVAEHIWRGYPGTWGGTHGRARQVQEMTAVTAACIAMRREVWDRVGGMDEAFARAFNDVDLCLRVRAAGFKVIFTPFAEAMHLESATRGLDDMPGLQQQFREEERQFRARWKNLEVDSRYHPSLAKSGTPYSLSTTPAVVAPWRAATDPTVGSIAR
ncbi:MAG: glycosyltransferase [Betaproteobacteria bacterium]